VGDEHLGNLVDIRNGHYVDDAAGLADHSGHIADEDLQALAHDSSTTWLVDGKHGVLPAHEPDGGWDRLAGICEGFGEAATGSDPGSLNVTARNFIPHRS
jgi:hypothetical protein